MHAAETLNAFETALRSIQGQKALLDKAHRENEWFLPALIHTAIDRMQPWFAPENASHFAHPSTQPQSIGIVMAGNLPLVGLHDLLMALLAGHKVLVKASRKDKALMDALHTQLPAELSVNIHIVDTISPDQIDFLLATGSDNTARHITHTYAETSRMLRKNRFSVAIIEGNESSEEIAALTEDILLYHGMGCRSVSNILCPENWDADVLWKALEQFPSELLAPAWKTLVNWENAVMEMGEHGPAKCQCVAVEEGKTVRAMPVGKLNLLRYTGGWEKYLEGLEDKIQCIVGRGMEVEFGKTQQPGLLDFADGVDTWTLLSGLSGEDLVSD